MIFLRGARQLVTLRGPAPPRRGNQLSDLGIIADGALLIDGERIHQVGTTRRIENLREARSARTIDVTGKVVLPGFADSHTRVILASLPSSPSVVSAGIAMSRAAADPPLPSSLRPGSPKELRSRARSWLQQFAAHGTTALEIRTGLNLDLQSETKALRAVQALDGEPLDVTGAVVAAGVSPGGPPRSDLDVEHVTDVLLPAIRRHRLAAFCDIECGAGAFDPAQARRILEAARGPQLRLRVQGDSGLHFEIAALALDAGATSVERLEMVSDDEIERLASSATIATLLPGLIAAHGVHRDASRRPPDRYPPARKLADRGAAIALATGFGPSSPTLSMPMVLSLACREMELSPAEAITAATLNGAASMGLAGRLGSLEPGKQADLAVFDVRDYREIPYYFGFNLCVMTMKKGRVIHEAKAGSFPQ